MTKNITLEKHEKYLREKVFYTNSKWPHFNLIFKDLKKFAKNSKKKFSYSVFRKKFFIWWHKFICTIFF